MDFEDENDELNWLRVRLSRGENFDLMNDFVNYRNELRMIREQEESDAKASEKKEKEKDLGR